MNVLSLVLILIGGYISLYVIYHGGLAAANALVPDRPLPGGPPATRFTIVIPAHNEELLLGRLLASIRTQRYPAELFTTVVVADNCSDETPVVARRAGAAVLERRDTVRTGKGHALRFALEHIDLSRSDALFIIDADSVMDAGVLLHLDRAVRGGNSVIQCSNGLANPDASWFTRLLDVSRTMGNEILHPAKVKLGLSSYLMGNGMCFTTRVLRAYGWDAFTVGEDWEYYAKLLQHGETVGFARQARVFHQESSSLRQATPQRMRWSSGRFAVAGRYGFRLLASGLAEANLTKIDGALPLLLPNPSLGLNITAAGLLLALLLPAPARTVFTVWLSALLALQAALFLVSIGYTKRKTAKLLSLFIAPVFLAWKMAIDALSLLGMGRKKWVKTERKA